MHRSIILSFLCLTTLVLRADIEVALSKDGPVTSLTEARDVVRKKRQSGEQGNAVIIVNAGRYEQSQALILEAQDSDLIIRAAKNAKPKFIGGS